MLHIVGVLIALIGAGLFIAGGIWLLVEAFRESLIWGLLCLFVSPVWIIFAILYWPRARKPIFMQLKGLGLMVLGAWLGDMCIASSGFFCG